MEWIPNVKRFNKNFPIFLLMTSGKNDVINFLKFYTYKAWILRIKIYTTKKTGRYVKDNLFSFRKWKQNLKILLCRFYCDFSEEYSWTGETKNIRKNRLVWTRMGTKIVLSCWKLQVWKFYVRRLLMFAYSDNFWEIEFRNFNSNA